MWVERKMRATLAPVRKYRVESTALAGWSGHALRDSLHQLWRSDAPDMLGMLHRDVRRVLQLAEELPAVRRTEEDALRPVEYEWVLPMSGVASRMSPQHVALLHLAVVLSGVAMAGSGKGYYAMAASCSAGVTLTQGGTQPALCSTSRAIQSLAVANCGRPGPR